MQGGGGEKESVEDALRLTPQEQQVTNFVSKVKDSVLAYVGEVSVFGIAIGYCLSASLLSIINKWAITVFPFPGALTALQYATSALGVWLFGMCRLLEHDRLSLITMWKFLPAAVCYYLSLFTNSELLLNANVDTFIVFRSAVPLFVAIGETVYLKQPWPASKTWASLGVILAGAILYVTVDSEFKLKTYYWAFAYLASMSIDFVYIKHIVMTVGLNTWGLVLYNNLEALLLFPIELFVMGEGMDLKNSARDLSIDWTSMTVWFPVILSCLFGLSISFFGFSCRRNISATSFTVLGVVNKLLTVVINLVVWEKHASALGTCGLIICIGGGVLYQQSTQKRKPPPPPVRAAEDADEENQPLNSSLDNAFNVETGKKASDSS